MKNTSQFFNVKLNIDSCVIVVLIMLLLISNISKGQTSSTNTLSSVNVLGSARVDSVIIGKDTIIAQRDIRVDGDIKVKGDAKIKGNLKLDGKIKFDNATGISYLPPSASSTMQGQYFFGKQSNNVSPTFIPCNSSTLTEGADPKFNFSGMMNSYSQGTNIDASMHMGMASWGSGMIEVGGLYNGQPSPGLLMNYFCGRNIAMCTGALGGNVYIGNFLNAAKHVEISNPLFPNSDANNVSLEISTLAGKGIKFNTSNNAVPLISINNSNFATSPFTLLGDGKTGINNTNPYKYLTVNADVSFANYGSNTNNGANGIEILGNDQIPTRRGISTDGDPNGNFNFYIHGFQNNSAFNFKNGNGNVSLMCIEANGKVFVGIKRIQSNHIHANSDFQVWGKIACKELVVVDPTKWSDFVFDKNYELIPFNEAEAYYTKHKHLKDVPSEKEVKENGINAAEMDATLLQKIEELYLYMAQQNKRIEKLEAENKLLKKTK